MTKHLPLLLFIGLGFSTTINIPKDYNIIQEYIDNSENVDTVLVHQGTYYESLNFNQKDDSSYVTEHLALLLLHL